MTAAGVLGPRLLTGELRTDDLAQVQRAREWAVRLTQACQRLMQRRIMHGRRGLPGVLFGVPATRRLISHVIALGPSRDNKTLCSPGSGASSSVALNIPWPLSSALKRG